MVVVPSPMARIWFPKFSCCSRSWGCKSGRSRRMLTVSQRTWICGQRVEFLRHELTICPRVPFGMIGKICRKSPPKQTTTPPNRQSSWRMSRKVQSTASNTCRCCITASSQNTKTVSRISVASAFCAGILQVESTWISIGILKCECAVIPPSSNVAAIPDDATARAMWPSDRTFANVKLMRNVFPVPPKLSRKNRPPFPALTALQISSYALHCSAFIRAESQSTFSRRSGTL